MQVPYSVLPASATTDPATATERSSTVAYAVGPPAPAGGAVLSTRIRLLSRFDADAGGTLVRRLLIVGPPGSTAAVYIGDPPSSTSVGAIGPAYQVDLTRRGDGDVADYDPPLYVPPSKSLLVMWTFTTNTSGAWFARLERA